MTATPPRVELARTGEGLAPTIEVVPVDRLGDHDHLDAIASEELSGLVVTDVFDPNRLRALTGFLQHHPGTAGPLRSAHFPGTTWGQVLVISPDDRAGYHERAADLRQVLAAAGSSLQADYLDALRRVAGNAPVAVPEDDRGRLYTGVTIRALPPRVEIAVHSEYSSWPSMADLATRLLVDGHQLSTYAPLRLPPDGGALQLFHRPPPGRQPSVDRLAPAAAIAALAAFGYSWVRPRPGDLLVFDGTRFNHRVTASATGSRWTAGGFIGRSANGWWLWS